MNRHDTLDCLTLDECMNQHRETGVTKERKTWDTKQKKVVVIGSGKTVKILPLSSQRILTWQIIPEIWD